MRATTGIIARLDVIEARRGFGINPRIKETERRLAPRDQEVVQEGDDARYGLPNGEQDLGGSSQSNAPELNNLYL